MKRPIKATSVLWMAAATLLAAVVLLPSSSTAEIMTGGVVGGTSSSSSSLHKTWSKFIQRQSLISKLDEPSSSSTADNDNNHRRTTAGGLAKLPCFVRRLPSTSQLLQQSTPLHKATKPQSMVDIEWSLATGHIITKIRGGAVGDDTTDDESSSDEDEYDSEYDEEYDSEYEDETDNDDEEEEQNDGTIVSSLTSSSLQSSLRSKSSSTTSTEQQQPQYDDVLAPPAMQQLVISLGVMFLSQRIDILDTKTVRIARFAFVTYVAIMQVFLLYVRFRAKAINDRTEITLSNPLASLVQGAAAAGGAGGGGVGVGGGGNFMVKALADQMLSSTTTIYEYDLAQAKKMNSGLLMPMIFLYFLHFKMKQVQPLLMQTATGVMNMVYSPLFQVYVLGRNLERPFKPPGSSMLDALQTEEEDGESSASSEQGVDDEDDVEEDDADEDEEESEESEGESDEGEEESDGDESEYDTDEE